MSIVRFLKKCFYRERAESSAYIEYLRKIGAQVGEDVIIYVPTKTRIDETSPCMLTIGNHVRITEGVVILTHDFSWYVCKGAFGGATLGGKGKVTIGNNVFIGMNAIITRNVTIGDDIIIGAGSVVTKDLTESGVYAGVPARKVCELSDFFEKRKEQQVEEACAQARAHRERFGKMPQAKDIEEYFCLFYDLETALENDWCVKRMKLHGNFDETCEYMKNNPPKFSGFDAFLEYCFKENKENNYEK